MDPITASTALSPNPRPGTPPPSDPQTSPILMQPDSVHKSATADQTQIYSADFMHAALNGAAHTAATTASAIAAGASGAIERVAPTLGELGAKGAEVAGGMARAMVPIAGATIGAGGFVLATTAPVGETPNQLAHARAIDAEGRQGSTTTTPATAQRGIEHTGNAAPVEHSPLHTGHQAPLVSEPTNTGNTKPLDASRIQHTGLPITQETAADHATMVMGSREALKALPGWSIEQRTVTRTDPAQARRDFDKSGGPREQFVKDLAKHQSPQLRAAGLTEGMIAEMARTGESPRGFNVHHIQALSLGGTNEPSNLDLVRTKPDHDVLSHQQATARAGMKIGETKAIDVLVPPTGTRVYSATQYIGASK